MTLEVGGLFLFGLDFWKNLCYTRVIVNKRSKQMQASTAQVRVVKSPNKYAKDCVRVLVAFNVDKVTSKNAIYVSGDLLIDDVPKMIIRAVDIVRAEDFVMQQ